MKDETITDKCANDVIKIYKGLGWVLTSFDPSLFQYFWATTSEGHFISKLRAHLSLLDKDVDDHFQIDKKEMFKKAVTEFIETNSNYREANIPETKWYLKLERRLEKKWYLYQLQKQGKMAFIRTHDLLANYRKKEDE
ncbi:MAG: hypothetical protein WAW11_01865 [Patescibacteria group bacterium]